MKDVLQRAASGLRILGQVERAHAAGNTREVERILAGIDPVDVMNTANELRFLAVALPDAPRPRLRQVPCK